MSAGAYGFTQLSLFHARKSGVSGCWAVPAGVRKQAARMTHRLERRNGKRLVAAEASFASASHVERAAQRRLDVYEALLDFDFPDIEVEDMDFDASEWDLEIEAALSGESELDALYDEPRQSIWYGTTV